MNAQNIQPPEASSTPVSWNSDHPEYATVKNGLVTAIAEGSATITAKCGKITKTCTVTVKPKTIAVNNITMNKPSTSLVQGGQETLSVTFDPPNATNQQLTWKSSDSEKVSVNEGQITAVAVTDSPVTITATSVDGSHEATCAVTVTAE